MTRTTRIHKLCNAIRKYKGLYTFIGGKKKWTIAPDVEKCRDIVRHCLQLGIKPDRAMRKIDALTTKEDFNRLVKTFPA